MSHLLAAQIVSASKPCSRLNRPPASARQSPLVLADRDTATSRWTRFTAAVTSATDNVGNSARSRSTYSPAFYSQSRSEEPAKCRRASHQVSGLRVLLTPGLSASPTLREHRQQHSGSG